MTDLPGRVPLRVEPGLAPGALWRVLVRPDGATFAACPIDLELDPEAMAERDQAWWSEGGMVCIYDGETGDLRVAITSDTLLIGVGIEIEL